MTFSQKIAKMIAKTDFSSNRVLVVGYGKMGREYVKALRALGVKNITVCSRSAVALEELKDQKGIVALSGGYQKLTQKPSEEELAIIATPIVDLVGTTYFLHELGYRKFLIEKPVALYSSVLEKLAKTLNHATCKTTVAYNRAAYPSLLEAQSLVAEEGGITSCAYTFTEFVNGDWKERFLEEELKHWGLANSLHVMSMAHALIGLPKIWHVHRTGNAIEWHPTGSVFVGSGLSEKGIPFSFHADWGSTGRWSVEVHTKQASYRFCPLEQIFKRTSFKEEWKEVPVKAFAPEIKIGFVEQVAAVLNKEVRKMIPLYSLQETVSLTGFGENIFGY